MIKPKKKIAIYLMQPKSISTKTDKYAPNPTNAKELFNNKDSQSPIPEIVPITGPNALSIYTYVPPEDGIAVANSDFDKAAGKIQIAANKYASQTDDPVFAAAKPGKTKIPLPSIPPMLIAITDDKFKLRCNFFKYYNFSLKQANFNNYEIGSMYFIKIKVCLFFLLLSAKFINNFNT